MATKKTQAVVAYKGFDKDLKCRGFKYAVGKEYKHKGKVEACEAGFHACENPLEVFNYYAPGQSRFCVVELSGELSRHDEDSKIAAARINIKAELALPQLISDAVRFVRTLCNASESTAATTGEGANAATTGEGANAATTGLHSVAAALGAESKAKAGAGGAIVLCNRAPDGVINYIRASKVGENGVLPDMWYMLNVMGEFEVSP